jgi:hypothetical protein
MRVLLDDLVRGGEERFWDSEAERLGMEPTPLRQHHAILTVYEKGLRRLKPDELAQLDAIIEKMSDAAW